MLFTIKRCLDEVSIHTSAALYGMEAIKEASAVYKGAGSTVKVWWVPAFLQ